eukprot:TRINITY_DN18222_c0_g1_i1.p1 TRINITY_DN18222_c0_g1~~TRINITY_DN18222_c0_g1_i1.p1  ORF type:complete len:322 (-),score=40.73 TRINITY_DN18222_c0_g1_i1:40-1005(-)
MPGPMLRWLVRVASVVVGAAAAATAAPATESPPKGAGDSGPYPSAADYVIVGGGTAGCALASRLCARLPTASVVLIERGRPRTPAQEFKVRAMSAVPDAWVDPSLTETWASAPNPGLGGRPVTLLTGATLGGSSAINGGQWSVPVAPYASTWGVDGLTEEAAQRAYDAVTRVVRPVVPPPSVRPAYTDEYVAAAAAAGIPHPEPAAAQGRHPRRWGMVQPHVSRRGRPPPRRVHGLPRPGGPPGGRALPTWCCCSARPSPRSSSLSGPQAGLARATPPREWRSSRHRPSTRVVPPPAPPPPLPTLQLAAARRLLPPGGRCC